MIIDVIFEAGSDLAYTRSVSQYDKGLRLRFFGISLPAEFEVHFSNQKEGGVATVVSGKNYSVGIPDAFVAQGEYIYAWIYTYGTKGGGTYDVDAEKEWVVYHPDGDKTIDPNKAATVYRVITPVQRRPAPVMMPGAESDEKFEYDVEGESLIITER